MCGVPILRLEEMIIRPLFSNLSFIIRWKPFFSARMAALVFPFMRQFSFFPTVSLLWARTGLPFWQTDDAGPSERTHQNHQPFSSFPLRHRFGSNTHLPSVGDVYHFPFLAGKIFPGSDFPGTANFLFSGQQMLTDQTNPPPPPP